MRFSNRPSLARLAALLVAPLAIGCYADRGHQVPPWGGAPGVVPGQTYSHSPAPHGAMQGAAPMQGQVQGQMHGQVHPGQTPQDDSAAGQPPGATSPPGNFAP